MTGAQAPGVIPEWDIADRVSKARRTAGFEQDELAERAGVSRRSISRYENGTAVPRGAAVIAIAFACGVDVNWLKDGETPTAPEGGRWGCSVRQQGLEPRTRC